MPYHVAQSGSCPTFKPWAVIKDDDGQVMGCHVSQAAANRQLAALYAQENNMSDLRNLPDAVRRRLAEGYGVDFLTERHPGFDIDYHKRTLEHRATRRVEVRAAADGSPVITGYATVYGHAYDVAGGPPFGWTETIAAGAADKSIAEQDDVYLFFDHEGLPLASTKAGTLSLESDKIGLYNEARIDARSPWSMEIVHRLERGELDAQSFAFRAMRQEWNEDYTERSILEVKLYDVSVVSFPANPATVAQVRSRHDLYPNRTAARETLAEIRKL
jgi:HK97 family phage prohead protease